MWIRIKYEVEKSYWSEAKNRTWEIVQPNIRLKTLCDDHVAYILGEISVILVKESGVPWYYESKYYTKSIGTM